jgi:ATP-binding cassette subfamily B protein
LSAVDTETEETILNNLNEICKDKTTIIVSHRVSAKNAHKIIIIDDGKIVEQGSHNQLVNQGGYYASLYLKQLSEKNYSNCCLIHIFMIFDLDLTTINGGKGL